MSHDILTNFAKIFQLNSFNNLSNPRNIEVIYQYISYNIPNPDGKEEEYIRTIQEYKKNVARFEKEFNYDFHYKKKVFRNMYLVLDELITYFNLKTEERTILTKGNRLRRFRKSFLLTLRRLKTLIRDTLKEDGGIRMGSRVFANYLEDSTEGLGRKYSFSSDILKDIREGRFGTEELNQIFKNLDKYSIRRDKQGIPKSWAKYGSGREGIRMYGSKKSFFGKGRSRIIFLIQNTAENKAQIEKRIGDRDPEDF